MSLRSWLRGPASTEEILSDTRVTYSPPTPPLDKVLPTDSRIVCRECDTDQPMASIVLLRSYALRDGKIVSEITGERVSCQVCGATFTIGPHGKFLQHADALPYSPQRQLGPALSPPSLPDDPPRSSVLKVPLKRPLI